MAPALASREPELAAGIRDPALLALQAASPRAVAPLGLPPPLSLVLSFSAAATPPPPAAKVLRKLGDSRMRPLLALVACQRDEEEEEERPAAAAADAETGAGEAPAA